MLSVWHILVIMGAALLATASPGPATLAIAGASMNGGRVQGLRLAAGVMCGSLIWSVSAAFGLAAIMLANAWLFEAMRYCGAAYLLFLAWKSACAAIRPTARTIGEGSSKPLRRPFLKGLLLHLTNPKAILFFGALYSAGLPRDVTIAGLAMVIGLIALQSAAIFFSYAILFSHRRAVEAYGRLRRWFDTAFATAFGFAGLKLLTFRI